MITKIINSKLYILAVFLVLGGCKTTQVLAGDPSTSDYDPSVTKFFKDEIVYRCGNKPFTVAKDFHLNK